MQQVNVLDKTFSLFLSYSELQVRIEALGEEISRDYAGKKPVFVGVLNGAFLFAADLLKAFEGQCEVSFVKVTSYQGTASTGSIRQLLGLNEDLTGRDVIIIEDIVDSGLTLQYLLANLQALKPASVKVAALLFKPDALKVNVHVHYKGFEVENDFLLGYGLDYNGYGRNLKHIYKLKN